MSRILVRLKTLAAMLILLSLLSACATHGSKTLDSQKILADNWLLRGRMSLNTPTDSLSLNILWKQQQSNYDVRLSNAFGLSMAHLWGDESHAVIKVPKRGEFEATSASALLLLQTGLDIPVEYLPYWVQGQPAPSVDYQSGKDRLKQSGWQIEYLKYKAGRPVRIKFTKSGIRLLLVVSAWQSLKPM